MLIIQSKEYHFICYVASDRGPVINIWPFVFQQRHASSVHNHVLKLNADEVGCVDGDGLYTGELLDVANTPFDFRSEKVIGDCIKDIIIRPDL